MASTEPPDIEPFELHVSDAEIEDLHRRLAMTRLPDAETVSGDSRWDQGVPLAELTELLDYWARQYDWRRLEADLVDAGQCRVTVRGLKFHVLHRRSPHPGAQPLLLSHGWPGSVVEFLDVSAPLTDPTDPAAPAFHVIAPSLPGFGFSDKPVLPGWGVERIADDWAQLMTSLGYERFIAHGGDWGGVISTVLAARHPERILLLHTTFGQAPPDLPEIGLSVTEKQWVAHTREFWRNRTGYARQQATRPQTIGYGLDDSPAGLLSWMFDKFAEWSDTHDSPFETIPRDRLLDNVSLHWFGRSGTSSARIYWESYGKLDPKLTVDVPTAITVFPREIEKHPRAWLAHRYRNIVSWREPDHGGHFPSLEVPATFVDELRTASTWE
ncbi:MAG: epoxide hydrolase family protein [Mycobacterium sp.]